MSVYRIKQGEQRVNLAVHITFGGAKPNPVPTSATMRLISKTTGQVYERPMTIDATPSDAINLLYDWQSSDWSGPTAIPAGVYRALWLMTQSGEQTIAPGIGYDTVIIEAT